MEVRVLNGVNPGRLGRREPFRAHSYISPVATVSIIGCGTDGCEPALRRPAMRKAR